METSFAFTKKRLEALEPADKLVEYRDTDTKGLTLMVTPAGVRTFYWRRRAMPWGNMRLKIGTFPDTTIDKARRQAAKHNGTLAGGGNPVADKRQQVEAVKLAKVEGVTLGEAFKAFKQQRQLKAGTLKQYEAVMERRFGKWLDKPMGAITRDMVLAEHRRLGQRSQAHANLAMRTLRSIIGFARVTFPEAVKENPVAVLSDARAWYRIGRRTRTVAEHKIGALLKAIDDLRREAPEDIAGKAKRKHRAEQIGADYIEFVMLTGLRRREAAGLTWADVDFEGATIRIPDTKAHRPLTLPMSSTMRTILERRQGQQREGEQYVFPSPGKVGEPLAEPRFITVMLSEKIGADFSVHDLRRLFLGTATRLAIPYLQVKALVNHSLSDDVTAGYVHVTTDDLKGPMQQISDYMMQQKAKAQGMKMATAG